MSKVYPTRKSQNSSGGRASDTQRRPAERRVRQRPRDRQNFRIPPTPPLPDVSKAEMHEMMKVSSRYSKMLFRRWKYFEQARTFYKYYGSPSYLPPTVIAPGYSNPYGCRDATHFGPNNGFTATQCAAIIQQFPADMHTAWPFTNRPTSFYTFQYQGLPGVGGRVTYRPAQAYVRINPDQSLARPSIQPGRMIRPATRPAVAPLVRPYPGYNLPGQGPRLTNMPVWALSLRKNSRTTEGRQTSNGPKAARRPVRIRERPPGKNKKEDKRFAGGISGAVNKPLRYLAKLAWATTEGLDLLDAVYDALPKRYRVRYQKGKPISPQQKAEAIYENWEHVDKTKMLLNIGANQVEDAIMGNANARANEVLTQVGVFRGQAF